MSNLTIKKDGLDTIETRVIMMIDNQIRRLRNKDKDKAKNYPEEKMPKNLDKND